MNDIIATINRIENLKQAEAQRQAARKTTQQNKDDFQFEKLSKSLKQNMNQKQFFIFLGVVCRKHSDRTFYNTNNAVAEYVGCNKTRELTCEEFVTEFGAK